MSLLFQISSFTQDVRKYSARLYYSSKLWIIFKTIGIVTPYKSDAKHI